MHIPITQQTKYYRIKMQNVKNYTYGGSPMIGGIYQEEEEEEEKLMISWALWRLSNEDHYKKVQESNATMWEL